MNNDLRISAWGIRHALGPISLPVRNDGGEIEWIQVTEGKPDVAIEEIPQHIADVFRVNEWEVPDWYLNNADADSLGELRRNLDAIGSRITTVTIDGPYAGAGDPVHREEDLREIERELEMMSALGVVSARVNLAPPPIVQAGSIAGFDVVVASVRRLSAFAQSHGIRLLIENHCELTSTPEDVMHFLDAVGPEVGFILDTGNIEPLQTAVLATFEGAPFGFVEDITPVLSFITALAERASIVHVKTYGFQEDGTPVLYDIRTVLQSIADAGYGGPITIECAQFDVPEQSYATIQRTHELINATHPMSR
ncbi:hypothetical protein ASD65_11125 [Microbacterium sp. Root61]|uniref:sugar phosphate isomerase/epimerase family protein n=1 Tax=Microbacterium sp. Root61 TaxID=1736570 RepID=UPI0006F8015C|nr:TIM barrel protein [Microbacterium sp. Root61]KRA24919.1 hypothetical protein ASD65_11125 [Microbacterium sp. Root61]